MYLKTCLYFLKIHSFETLCIITIKKTILISIIKNPKVETFELSKMESSKANRILFTILLAIFSYLHKASHYDKTLVYQSGKRRIKNELDVIQRGTLFHKQAGTASRCIKRPLPGCVGTFTFFVFIRETERTRPSWKRIKQRVKLCSCPLQAHPVKVSVEDILHGTISCRSSSLLFYGN